MNKKLWLASTVIIWLAFFTASGLIFYVNHYMPHGQNYSTGMDRCDFSDEGPCGEILKEDLDDLNIPAWAKFFKESGSNLLWMGLLFAGIVISSIDKK